MSEQDKTDNTGNDKEKFWDNLTKEYLTTEQKLAIIAEHNAKLATEKWEKTLAYLAKATKK